MTRLSFLERPAGGDPRGLLVLHHGRGADEQDLLPLADALDPRRRLHVVTPAAPLTPAGSTGRHWYLVPRVGYPDPETFDLAYRSLARFHDELWERTGIEPSRTVLGGFSMGAVMSYALGLGRGRPVPGGILALSGFLPSVPGWQPDLATRRGLAVLIAHGRRDPVISVGLAREARERLSKGGLQVDYHEFDGGHGVEPSLLGVAADWLAATLELGPDAAARAGDRRSA
ncbi:MAG TPA: phospholipase [Solirubrobacteraceae bacterium]|nr:phospholipase [Solirubrobacteraceae bacterium]